MSEKEEKRIPILLLMVLCLILSYQPMAFTGLTYWDVSTDWRFYSGTALNSGPVTFTAPFTTTNMNPDGSLVKFSSFNMGDHWEEIGFKAPVNASMLVTYVGSSEAHFVAQPVGGLRTFEIYAPEKGEPVNVSGGVSWSYSDANEIVSVNTNIVENIAVTWALVNVEIVNAFNLELLLFAGLALIATLGAFLGSAIVGAVAGALGIFLWYFTAQWFIMGEAGASTTVFAYVFYMLAIVSVFMALKNVLEIYNEITRKGGYG